MFNQLASFLGLKNNYKIQSFTFFIPSPPPRSSGYREKQFDKVFYEFINRGYRILNFTTQVSSGEKQSGMWIILLVQALNKEASCLNLDETFLDSIQTQSTTKEAIEGFYYINDQAEENEK